MKEIELLIEIVKAAQNTEISTGKLQMSLELADAIIMAEEYLELEGRRIFLTQSLN